MILEYIKNDDSKLSKLVISSNKLIAYIDGTDTYEKVEFVVHHCDSKYKVLSITDPSTSPYIDMDNKKGVITAKQLGLTKYEDSIWSVQIKYYKNTSICGSEETLTFIGDKIRCDVIEEVSNNPDSDAGVLYYFLSQADKCPCKEDDLCNILKRLKEILYGGCK